jgi:hypothetical protein
MTTAEIEGYDLSTTGTVVEIKNTSSDVVYGFLIDATAAATFVIEVSGGTVGPIKIDSFSDTESVDDGFQGPEAVDVRIRNTTTASGTADAMLGTGRR